LGSEEHLQQQQQQQTGESNPIHPILQMLSQDLITTLIGHRKQAGIFQPLSGARSIRSSNKLAAFTKSKILHSWV
jgi:hypothetical protein